MKILKNMDKKTKIYLIFGLGIIFIFILIILILKLVVGTSINSKTFESRLKSAATNYYEDHKKELPKINGEKITISIDKLVSENYLKDPEKSLKKGLTCEGNVNVSKNNGYYLYQPVIECSDGYKTNLLYKNILKNNKIKTQGEGLYQVGDYYLFKGENINNNVKFVGMKWKILRINNDNTIRIILADNLETVEWDDRYNKETDYSSGKNDFNVSRIKQTLLNYFNNKYDITFKKEDKALIVPTELCIGAKNINSSIIDGSIECSKKTEKLPIGLLQVNEYNLASLDPDCKNTNDSQCANYNFIANLNSFWTLTANSENSYKVLKISGIVVSNEAYVYSQPRFVLTISSDALYSEGNGSVENPYIIK